jgi:hypothetical protein
MAKNKPNLGGGGNSHQRIVARTAQGKDSIPTSVAAPTTTMESHFSASDSLTLLALLVGIFLVIIVPNLITKVVLLFADCGGFVWLVRRSHWTRMLSSLRRTGISAIVLTLLLIVSIPQFVAQWRTEHQATVAMSGSPPTLESLMKESMPTMNKMFREYPISTKDGKSLTIEGIVYTDLIARSSFTAFYIPSSPYAFSVAIFLAKSAHEFDDDLTHSMIIKSREPGEPPQNSASFVHTGKIVVYHDDFLTHRQMADIEDAFDKEHLNAVLRGPDYLATALRRQAKGDGDSRPGKL